MLIRAAVRIQLLIILNSVVTLQTLKTWGDKQLFPPQKIPDGALNPLRSVVHRKIVLYHNFFRSKVRPTASNMLLMSWHNGAAHQAQKYAEQCVFLTHNNPQENTVPHLGTCGQNLFVAAQKTPWYFYHSDVCTSPSLRRLNNFGVPSRPPAKKAYPRFFAIKTWFVEYRNFTYGQPYVNLKATGHYTQMVWATSHKVGCGIAHCPGGPWGHFYNYVCHYCPGGNYDTITQYPYKKGKPCEDCPNNCVDSLCTNACPRRDLYSNCQELVGLSSSICTQGTCNATCECGNEKIHKNYPW